MILVSVGTQLPFDRLIKAVDLWAFANARTDVVAQIGRSAYVPQAIRSFAMTSPREFLGLQEQAKVLISHAGTGSLLAALELKKPIIIMPRDHRRGEHRNAHQEATAAQFKGRSGVYLADDEDKLMALLSSLPSLVASVEDLDTSAEAFALRLRGYIECG